MKVVVLGGGPGGYVAAIRAAQLGAEVTLIEKKALGGTCLNVGCIPTKVLLHTTELYTALKRESAEIGLEVPQIAVDWKRLQKRKDKMIRINAGGIDALLKKNKVTKIIGTGRFTGVHELEVSKEDGSLQTVVFDRAIVATGSEPSRVPIPGTELSAVITSEEALSLPEVPDSLCIIGGGVIGCEFASIYSSLGCKVTIIEMLPELIAVMDRDIVHCLRKEFAAAGVDVHTETRVERIEQTPKGLSITAVAPSGPITIEAEKVLLSIGRRPKTSGLGLEILGVSTKKGAIEVDRNMRTAVPSIYAIGDCIGGVMLAHVASAEGVVAAEHIMGEPSPVDFRTVPSCVYTRPELASVGLTEDEARNQGRDVKTGIFPLQANGKSMIMGETNGLVKYVTDARTGEILGLHIAGPRATDMIAQGALALRLEATLDEIETTVHAHPTVSEALLEAALAVNHRAIHSH